MSHGPLDIQRIRSLIAPRRVGRRILYVDTTSSTNDVAWSYLHQARIRRPPHPALSPEGGEGSYGTPQVDTPHGAFAVDVVDHAYIANAPTADGAGGDPDGLVVLAEHQSAGRGRLGRRWVSPRGAGVLASVLLVDETFEPAAASVSIIAAVAAREAIAAACAVSCEIKWPNDLMIRGRKVGGILVEARQSGAAPAGPAGCNSSQRNGESSSRAPRHSPRSGEPPNSPRSGEPPSSPAACVIGIGINCLQHPGHFKDDLRETATSLDIETNEPVDRDLVAGFLIAALDRWLARPRAWAADDLRRAWIDGTQPLGKRVHLLSDGRDYYGHVVDLDPMAGLVVELDGGVRRAFSAATTTEVKLTPPG